MPDRFVLGDSNVLIHLTNTDSAFHLTARHAVETLDSQGVKLQYTSQNLAEFWNVCTRPKPSGLELTQEQTIARSRIVEDRFGYLPESVSAERTFKDLLVRYKVRGVQVHDARLAALMLANDVNEILTFDQRDFRRYAELTVIHPDDVY